MVLCYKLMYAHHAISMITALAGNRQPCFFGKFYRFLARIADFQEKLFLLFSFQCKINLAPGRAGFLNSLDGVFHKISRYNCQVIVVYQVLIWYPGQELF